MTDHPTEPASGAPALTLAQVRKFDPCEESWTRARGLFPAKHRAKITVAQARAAGATFDDLIWVLSAWARREPDIERRLRLWMADCAARVLPIFERERLSDVRPREAIIAARRFARGEIEAAAMAAAMAAARAAAWDAAEAAARAAARAAAMAAARAAAWDAAEAAARDAARDAEEAWQFDRLVARFSTDEPEDWPLDAPSSNRSAA